MANTRHPPPRHARESGHPEDIGLSSRAWIPAFVGMTKSAYPLTGSPYAISLLAFETQTIRFWTRVRSHYASIKRLCIFATLVGYSEYSVEKVR